MSVEDATGYITRAGLTLANLNLFVPGALPADQSIPVYDFVEDGLNLGASVKRRQIAESMYMDGATQAQSSKAMSTAPLSLFVTGHDPTSLQDNYEALCDAVNQASWELHVTFGSDTAAPAEWAWTFWDAEITPGFPVEAWYGLYQPILVTAPRSPIVVAGPTF